METLLLRREREVTSELSNGLGPRTDTKPPLGPVHTDANVLRRLVETAVERPRKSLQSVAVVDSEPTAGSSSEPFADGGTALERLIECWAEVAVSHAIVRTIDDPAGLIATVAGIDGAWGFGESEAGALDDLRSVLVDWASLKLEDGDDDIPSMEGIHLVTAP